MTGNFWGMNNNEEEEDYQNPDLAGIEEEASQDSEVQDEQEFSEREEPSYEEALLEEINSQDEEAQESIVNEAEIRLAQASLYKMLLDHALFEGVNSHPLAVKKVEKEIKDYILERLEVLLGMREDKKKKLPEAIAVELPFNDIEIKALKDMAFKLTKGVSASAEPSVAKAVPKNREEPKKPQAIKPLKLGSLKEKPKPVAPSQAKSKPEEKRPSYKPSQAKKPSLDQNIDKIDSLLSKLNLDPRVNKVDTRAIKEGLAKELSRELPSKPVHEMNEDEILEHIKKTSNKYTSTKPNNYIPPATGENALQQKMMVYQTNRISTNVGRSGNLINESLKQLGAVGIEDIGDGE
jgi:hypothetical protein